MNAPTEAPPVEPQVKQALRQYWGFDTLRPLQAEAIQAGLDGRDSLVVLPTGGGKSLCYQVPPVVAQRTDVVISPLIALMKDQVDGLRTAGYPAEALHTNLSLDEVRAAERRIAEGRARLVFIAPERAFNSGLTRLLREIDVRAIAVDESHCISHWGHDFRHHYRRLAELRDLLPGASMHAFTATATERVRLDIASQLRLRNPLTLVGSFDRPNLTYRISPRSDLREQTLEIIHRHSGQAIIIYCISRKDTESLATFLCSKKLRAACYHAGLSPAARRTTQERFSSEKLDVIVATVAFGMGIDRSDVRCVIHAAAPKSIEHYQQETGRAGRDGLAAECVLLYSPADAMKWESLIERSAQEAEAPQAVIDASLRRIAEMRAFCEAPHCRHAGLVAYFGQRYDKPNCGACDICLNEAGERLDGLIIAQKILSCVARCEERFGVSHIVEVLRGGRSERVQRCQHDQLSTHGLLREMDEPTVRDFVYQLIGQNLLQRSGGEYPVLQLNANSWEVMRGKRDVSFTRAQRQVRRSKPQVADAEGVSQSLFEALRALRRELAEDRGVPAFVIFSDAVLRDLARARPTSEKTMRRISGVGPRKLEDFGRAFMALIADHSAEHRLETDVFP